VEHRVIRGGEHYIGFARNQIKQLRAAGLEHAQKNYILPDADVTVRIDGEHDFISLAGVANRLWVLIQTTNSSDYNSAIFELDRIDPMDASKAVFIYSGNTEYVYDASLDTPGAYYLHLNPTNTFGAITGAVVVNGNLLMYQKTINTDIEGTQTAELINIERESTVTSTMEVRVGDENQSLFELVQESSLVGADEDDEITFRDGSISKLFNGEANAGVIYSPFYVHGSVPFGVHFEVTTFANAELVLGSVDAGEFDPAPIPETYKLPLALPLETRALDDVGLRLSSFPVREEPYTDAEIGHYNKGHNWFQIGTKIFDRFGNVLPIFEFYPGSPSFANNIDGIAISKSYAIRLNESTFKPQVFSVLQGTAYGSEFDVTALPGLDSIIGFEAVFEASTNDYAFGYSLLDEPVRAKFTRLYDGFPGGGYDVSISFFGDEKDKMTSDWKPRTGVAA
jgi:hypothetical protein